VLVAPWPEPIFLFQLDLHDATNNIKHYANIDHETPCSELSMQFLNASILHFSSSASFGYSNSFLITEWSLNALLDYYNKDLYRFEFKSTGARNNALKLLERNGFDYDLVENLKGYVVELPKISEICTDPEKLRGLQGNRERADIPDEGSGGGRGSCGPRRKNSRRRDCLQIKLLAPRYSLWVAS